MASTTPVMACQRIFVGCPADQSQKPETSMPAAASDLRYGSRRNGERMRGGHEVECGGGEVALELLDRLAAGDHRADSRVLQAPGKCPARQRHPRGDLAGRDLLNPGEPHVDVGGVL